MTPASSVDDERLREIRQRSIVWETDLDPSGWPLQPSWWTEDDADEIRRNHGLRADERLIPIHEHGAELDEKYRGLDLLIVGSPCIADDSLEVLEDIGAIPRLRLPPLTPSHEGRVLLVWLTRIELDGTSLWMEQRLSLRDEFSHDELVVGDLRQRHTQKEYLDLRRRGLDLLSILFEKRGGRPTNREKPHPVKVELARLAATLRDKEPALSWDQIAARLATKYSAKTVQRLVERDRLHEL